jgi:hypothetical protein
VTRQSTTDVHVGGRRDRRLFEPGNCELYPTGGQAGIGTRGNVHARRNSARRGGHATGRGAAHHTDDTGTGTRVPTTGPVGIEATARNEPSSRGANPGDVSPRLEHQNTCQEPPRPREPRKQFGNDPSAGSPTETLLRLLLPLDDQV